VSSAAVLIGVYIVFIGIRILLTGRHQAPGPRKIPRLWSAAVIVPMILLISGLVIVAVLTLRRPAVVQVPVSDIQLPASELAQGMEAAFGQASYWDAIAQAKQLIRTYPEKGDQLGRAWEIIGTSSCLLKDSKGAMDAWNALGNLEFARGLNLKVQDACAKVGI